jgi:NADH pyrophosphatase NudC (nudix superfamily)
MSTLQSGCPGAITIREAKPEYANCPHCGQETEIWSDERKGRCHHCGGMLFRENAPSCIDWCAYAKECIGEAKYRTLKEESVV